MDWDEAKSKSAKGVVLGEDLSVHSIAELEARIAALEIEVVRVRGEVAKKQAQKSAAASLFKSG